jgi:hypothetical protein
MARSFELSDLDGSVTDLPVSAQSLLSEWLESYEMKVRLPQTPAALLSSAHTVADRFCLGSPLSNRPHSQHDFVGNLKDPDWGGPIAIRSMGISRPHAGGLPFRAA